LEDFFNNYTQGKVMNKMLKNILTKNGKENVLEFLSQNLSSSELNTLLLEVFNQRIQNLRPREVLHNYVNNRFLSTGQN